jgi:transcriptional regulator with XRE-family HTH domain
MLTCRVGSDGAESFRKTSKISQAAVSPREAKISCKSTEMTKPASYAQWYLEPYCIGTKLRTLRTQKRLTLSRLAAETGLSTALLSKLETDRMVPTLPTLATISRVYGIGLSYFFAEPEQHSISITRKAHLESNPRGLDAVTVTPLHAAASDDKLAARMMEFAPGSPGFTGAGPGDTAGLIYVLEGRLQIDAGALTEVLETGDCVYLKSKMAPALSAAGKHRCRVLSVTPVA